MDDGEGDEEGRFFGGGLNTEQNVKRLPLGDGLALSLKIANP